MKRKEVEVARGVGDISILNASYGWMCSGQNDRKDKMKKRCKGIWSDKLLYMRSTYRTGA